MRALNPLVEDERSRSRGAFRARVILQAAREALPRTHAGPFKYERRKGSGAPNGASISDSRASMRRHSRGHLRPHAFRRSTAVFCRGFHTSTRPGPRFLESPDPNGRTLSGASAVSTSQTTIKWWTGRCPSRLRAKSDELRPQEPHPLRQSASPVDVPHEERDGPCYSNRGSAVKEFIPQSI